MAENTKIQWAYSTWSPWHGCTKVSDGCKFCYAEAMSRRNHAVFGEWGPNGKRVVNADWGKPLAWDKAAAKAGERRRIFPSLCDWLEDRPELIEPRARFMDLIARTPNLDWLLLTKRPENFRRLMAPLVTLSFLRNTDAMREGGSHTMVRNWLDGQGPSNVWLGASVESQRFANERLPKLMSIHAPVQWVSYEPALGHVDFEPWMGYLGWIVVGGESGSKARPFDADWARSVVKQGREYNVPVFVKQMGDKPYDSDVDSDWPSTMIRGHAGFPAPVLEEPKGGDPLEWPADLRVRQFPGRPL